MTFLLDTDTCSAHMRRPAKLAHRFIQYTGQQRKGGTQTRVGRTFQLLPKRHQGSIVTTKAAPAEKPAASESVRSPAHFPSPVEAFGPPSYLEALMDSAWFPAPSRCRRLLGDHMPGNGLRSAGTFVPHFGHRPQREQAVWWESKVWPQPQQKISAMTTLATSSSP